MIHPETRTDSLESLRRGVNAQSMSLTLLMRLDQIVGFDPGNDGDDNDRDGNTPQEAQ